MHFPPFCSQTELHSCSSPCEYVGGNGPWNLPMSPALCSLTAGKNKNVPVNDYIHLMICWWRSKNTPQNGRLVSVFQKSLFTSYVCWLYVWPIISFVSDTSLERYPLAELTSGDNTSATCLTTGLVWDLSVLPTLYLPTSQTESPSVPGPLDLSSPSSLSSSASSCGEEDEGRTSDPPSPEPVHTYAPRQRMKCTGVIPHISPPEEEEEREVPVTAARPAFLCKHCPKEYTSLGALKMHIRSHTLPCVCTTCGKAFSRPWLLRGHIRTHTGNIHS